MFPSPAGSRETVGSGSDRYCAEGASMGTRIRITVAQVSLLGELFDTPCAAMIAAKLPIVTRPNRWGDEFYFEIPLGVDLDDTATTLVKVGDIGFWPPGLPGIT
jgi:uncharacterized protein